MKRIFLVVTLALLAGVSFGQTKIKVEEALKNDGKTVTICSDVYGVKTTPKATFIDVGAGYPKAPLTLVIFAKDLPNFKEAPEKMYGNFAICVTGKVQVFKGKAEIVITKPEEIVLDYSK